MPTPRRIPFIEARFLDALPKPQDVERRLTDHLLRLRDDGWTPDPQEAEVEGEVADEVGTGVRAKLDASPDYHNALYGLGGVYDRAQRRRKHFIKEADETVIARRSRRYVERVAASTGLTHLGKEDIQRLKVLRDGATLVSVESEHRADEIAAALHDDMPWMGSANERVWHAMRASVRQGAPGLRLPPLLLVGPPGIGKSHWARTLGRLLGTPTTVVDASGEPASFGIVGTQKGWGTAGPGRLTETILGSLVANPLIVIDEVEKPGGTSDTRGRSYRLTDALLPLLERSTATRWSCPYFRVVFDMSWVGWVMTANATAGLPAPFLSRVPPTMLPDLTRDHVLAFARRQASARGLPDVAVEAIVSALDTASDVRRPSLRTVTRMVERAEAVLARPPLH